MCTKTYAYSHIVLQKITTKLYNEEKKSGAQNLQLVYKTLANSKATRVMNNE